MAETITVLIVEDEPIWQEIYCDFLQGDDFEITAASRVDEAFNLLTQKVFDVVVTDLRMLGYDEEFGGFKVLQRAKELNADTEVIVMTGYGTQDRAFKATVQGAFDYITKPIKPDRFRLSIKSAAETRRQRLRALRSKQALQADVQPTLATIIGNSAAMKQAFEHASRALNTDVNVFILGESGTGKELFARAIHFSGSRSEGPFVVVDCARLSDDMDILLFGQEKEDGRFQPGKFELAGEGTILFDEIADLRLDLQGKLVRAFQSKEFERKGETECVKVNSRIITTTNRDLWHMVETGTFRRDLYHALRVLSIDIPPLRDRKDSDDIATLAGHFLRKHAPYMTLSQEALRLLQQYDYPGNVRELENVIKTAALITQGNEIQAHDLPRELRASIETTRTVWQPTAQEIENLKKRYHIYSGNILKLKLQKAQYGMNPPLQIENEITAMEQELQRLLEDARQFGLKEQDLRE